jgi:hypothetical protein
MLAVSLSPSLCLQSRRTHLSDRARFMIASDKLDPLRIAKLETGEE